MIRNETVIEGTLKPDGTLELDKKPDPAPGRVTVVLRQEARLEPLLEDWWQFMQRSCRELEASGASFMRAQCVNAHVE